MTKTEKVMCFRTERLRQLGAFHGLSLDVERYSALTRDVVFIDRDEAERNPEYKQIIPYVIILNGDGLVFQYQRGKKGQEKRLHGLLSIGVGGHINDGDPNYSAAMRREIEEEIGLPVFGDVPILAAVNDDYTELGRVHFGFVHRIHALGRMKLEDTLVEPRFVNPNQLQPLEDYESWSAFCIQQLSRILKSA